MRQMKSKKGFTLVEMIVSIALFALIALTIAVTIAASKLIENKNRQKAESISIKTGIADQIKANQFSWVDEDGFKNWLIDNSYTALNTDKTKFSATVEKNNIDYSVLVYVYDTPVTKLFEVCIAVDSPLNEPTELYTRYYG